MYSIEENQASMEEELSYADDQCWSMTSQQGQMNHVAPRLPGHRHEDNSQFGNFRALADPFGPSTSRGPRQHIFNPEFANFGAKNDSDELLGITLPNEQLLAYTKLKKTPEAKKALHQRRNGRLQKLIAPKSALAALNELVPEVKILFHPDASESLFIAYTHINGVFYQGKDSSKSRAKQDLANQVLRHIYLKKILESSEPKSAQTPMHTDNDSPEIDMQWEQLASYAIYKLAQEWQSQLGKSDDLVEEPVAKKRREQHIPKNATLLDPVCLLNNLCHGVRFIELAQSDPSVFNMAVDVDGAIFVGVSERKKDAKKKAAIAALKDGFGMTYG